MRVQNKFKDDSAIASRYLADQLTPAEREEFEAHLLRSPEAAEELEATARLKVGLGKLQDSGELPKLLGAKSLFQRPTFLAAAAFVPLAAIGLLIARQALMSEPSMLAASAQAFVDQSSQGLRPGETYALERLRGGNYDLQFVLPDSRQAIELRVRPAATGGTATQYNVALSVIQDGGASVPVAVLKGLRPAPDQYISVFADSALLKPGRYQLVVRLDGSKSPDAEEIFLIRVRPAGSAEPDAT
jgi:hypothetical protein